MARIRVGDIEIDGTNVTISGVNQIPQPAAALPPRPLAMVPVAVSAEPMVPEPDPLVHLPVSTTTLVVGGTFVAIGGVVCAAVGIFTGGFLAPIGAGLIVLGALKQRALRNAAAARARAEEKALSKHADKIAGLLAGHSSQQTFEWLLARASLPEATVVRTLAYLRARGEVAEELDTDSGNWYYTAAPRALMAPPADLDARLEALEKKGAKIDEG